MKNVPATKEERVAKPEAEKLGAHFCGGVLIHKDWVLTAAHCVVDTRTRDKPLDLKTMGAGIGSKDLVEMYDNGRTVLEQVIIKPGYDSSLADSKQDDALVKLSKPANLTNAKLACLVKDEPTELYPSPMTAIGWGNINVMVYNEKKQSWSGIQGPRRLKMAEMKQVPYKDSYCDRRRDLICILGKAKAMGHATAIVVDLLFPMMTG